MEWELNPYILRTSACYFYGTENNFTNTKKSWSHPQLWHFFLSKIPSKNKLKNCADSKNFKKSWVNQKSRRMKPGADVFSSWISGCMFLLTLDSFITSWNRREKAEILNYLWIIFINFGMQNLLIAIGDFTKTVRHFHAYSLGNNCKTGKKFYRNAKAQMLTLLSLNCESRERYLY